ncbi:unnamed protein product [Medioppia subpectinata]|uniref:BRCT domain-containing protein n=1 Tax=Medioppia subpectinata TaxID=1979941 RepID=A0A7R9PZX3_9ACAR|nr:unnamed protein product [Medioppia subpectinata]CAG2107442.1 unnamed protein product [Medioppia subpectinata]
MGETPFSLVFHLSNCRTPVIDTAHCVRRHVLSGDNKCPKCFAINYTNDCKDDLYFNSLLKISHKINKLLDQRESKPLAKQSPIKVSAKQVVTKSGDQSKGHASGYQKDLIIQSLKACVADSAKNKQKSGSVCDPKSVNNKPLNKEALKPVIKEALKPVIKESPLKSAPPMTAKPALNARKSVEFVDVVDTDSMDSIESIPNSIEDSYGEPTEISGLNNETTAEDKTTEMASAVLEGLESNNDRLSIDFLDSSFGSHTDGNQSLPTARNSSQEKEKAFKKVMDWKSCQTSQHIVDTGMQTQNSPKKVLKSVSIQVVAKLCNQSIQTDPLLDINTDNAAKETTNCCESNNCCFHKESKPLAKQSPIKVSAKQVVTKSGDQSKGHASGYQKDLIIQSLKACVADSAKNKQKSGSVCDPKSVNNKPLNKEALKPVIKESPLKSAPPMTEKPALNARKSVEFVDVVDTDSMDSIDSIPNSIEDSYGEPTEISGLNNETTVEDKTTEMASAVLEGLESNNDRLSIDFLDSSFGSQTDGNQSLPTARNSSQEKEKAFKKVMDWKSCQTSQHIVDTGMQTQNSPKKKEKAFKKVMDWKSCQTSQHIVDTGMQTQNSPKKVLKSVSIQVVAKLCNQSIQTDPLLDINTDNAAKETTNCCESNNCCFHKSIDNIPCHSLQMFLKQLVEFKANQSITNDNQLAINSDEVKATSEPSVSAKPINEIENREEEAVLVPVIDRLSTQDIHWAVKSYSSKRSSFESITRSKKPKTELKSDSNVEEVVELIETDKERVPELMAPKVAEESVQEVADDSVFIFEDPPEVVEPKQKPKRKVVTKKTAKSKALVVEEEEEEDEEPKPVAKNVRKRQIISTESEETPKADTKRTKSKFNPTIASTAAKPEKSVFKRPVSPAPSEAPSDVSMASSTSSRQRTSSSERSTQRCVILYSGLEEKQIKKIQSVCRELNAEAVTEWSDKVTHLVIALFKDTTKEGLICPRNAKYLKALLANKWIVSFDWIMDSYRSNRFVDEFKYEISADRTATEAHIPRRSRTSGQKLFQNIMCHFNGIKGNLLSELQQFVVIGGGVVVDSIEEFAKSKRKNGFKKLLSVSEAIGLPNTQTDGIKYVSRNSLMDSIANFSPL